MSAEKKISSKNQPSYRHGGLEKGSLFDYKIDRYEKIRIFLANGMCQPVRVGIAVNKMSGSEKVMVGPQSTPDSPRSAALTHNSPW